MPQETKHQAQKAFIAKKKAEGLQRIVLWARPDDIDDLKLAARQPHSLAKLRTRVEAELRASLEPVITAQVTEKLRRRTERALLAQKRKQAQIHQVGSNTPPARIRFATRPPATIRNHLKSSGWLYDPVAAVWHVPTDPTQWDAVTKTLEQLEPYGATKLATESENE